MKPIVSFSFIIALLLKSFGVLHTQSIDPGEIDSLVAYTMDATPLAGMAIAVVKDGKVVHMKGYGITAANDPHPVDEHTSFAIASNTKAFTATALAILVEDGKLAWTDRVVDYIPEFRMYAPYVTENFNIQDLLTHRSGLGLGAGDLMFFPDGSDFTIQDVLKSFQYQKPVSAFRTRYDYDNLLYLVAGEVVARASGMTWAEFIHTRIMEPLGMDDSAPVFGQLRKTDNVAVPHNEVKGKLNQLEVYTKPHDNLGAAGGIYSSVSDLSQWMLMNLNQGVYDLESGKRLFTRESQREMWKPHSNIDFELIPGPPYYSHFLAYGLGWAIRERNGMICLEHTGGHPGMLSRTILVPEMELGIVVLTNTNPGGLSFRSISQTILDEYLGIKGEDWIATSIRQLNSDNSTADSVVNRVWQTVEENKGIEITADKFTGIYQDDWFGKVQIREKKGQLWFSALRSPKLNGPMSFYKANTFAIRWEYQDMKCDAFANFILDTEGNAIAIKMKGISPEIDFSFDFPDLELKRIMN